MLTDADDGLVDAVTEWLEAHTPHQIAAKLLMPEELLPLIQTWIKTHSAYEAARRLGIG
jgi:hypothetical protein